MDYDYGPLCTYEITWRSGHVETVRGHQVLSGSGWGMGGFGTLAPVPAGEPRFTIHGMFGDHWRMVLTAPESEVHSIRDVTDREHIPADREAA